jgi:predicted ATPase
MLIQELRLRGMLSFGPESPALKMLPLNVLIGPNGSGKSNLIDGIDLLRSSATKLSAPIRGTGGGVQEWLWKGESGDRMAVVYGVCVPDKGDKSISHELKFRDEESRFYLVVEDIIQGNRGDSLYFNDRSEAWIRTREGNCKTIPIAELAPDESILTQRKDPDQFPELAYLAQKYKSVRIYRDWSFGRSSILRKPQPADLPSSYLEEDFSNLGLFLSRLRRVPKAKKKIIEHLRDLYSGLEDFDVEVKGGTVEVFLTERDFTIPASRLSDGTLRYLCLLAILCDPEPPALICIEEPELGLHPDMIPKIADLLIEASERTQIVVTTHSDILVDAMSERPEAVVIIEKQEGQTTTRRLENDAELREWLQKYRLGQLWTRGEIGGVRW